MYDTWKLSEDQCVVYVHQRYIYFQQKRHGSSYMIFLNFHQFSIIDEVIRRFPLIDEMDKLYFPLGNGVTFTIKNNRACIQYIDKRIRRYILFHYDAWTYYITRVHSELMTLVKHERRYKGCECTLANERNISFGHSRNIRRFKRRSKDRRRKVLSRQTTYDTLENDERENHSLLHRRRHSSHREDSVMSGCFEDTKSFTMVDEQENENDGDNESEH